MLIELLRFLAGALLLIVPGILLGGALRLGGDRAARCTIGAWLGFAMAIYLGSAVSEFDLRWFYPAWAGLGVILIAVPVLRKTPARPLERMDRGEIGWLIFVLLLVAITRYAIALPALLPMGIDPPVFLILARKLQLTHHAVLDWQPFASPPVNFPDGAPMLVAILSTICGLPVQTVFKDLIPLIGVMGTALVYVLTRRIARPKNAGLYAAMAYGMWAGLGSIDFYQWGGMPNEIAILLFLAALCAWLIEGPWPARLAAASLLYAATILAHHHTQIAGAGILLTVIVWMTLARRDRRETAILALSVAGALLLDGFYLVSYLPKIGILKHTNALYSEWPISLSPMIPYMGLPLVLAAITGAMFCHQRRRAQCHPVLICACVALVAMFATCEYVPMPFMPPPPPPPRRHWVLFTPTHFLNDLPCFLAGFAGVAVAVAADSLHLVRTSVMGAMLVLSASVYDVWRQQIGRPGVSADYLAACQWIEQNTSPDSIVRGDGWTRFLSWRCGEIFDLPNSERSDEAHPKSEHVALILAGKLPPDSPEMKEVEIVPAAERDARPVLWQSAGGLQVVQDWPN